MLTEDLTAWLILLVQLRYSRVRQTVMASTRRIEAVTPLFVSPLLITHTYSQSLSKMTGRTNTGGMRKWSMYAVVLIVLIMVEYVV
jgi:hypothetical protein